MTVSELIRKANEMVVEELISGQYEVLEIDEPTISILTFSGQTFNFFCSTETAATGLSHASYHENKNSFDLKLDKDVTTILYTVLRNVISQHERDQIAARIEQDQLKLARLNRGF